MFVVWLRLKLPSHIHCRNDAELCQTCKKTKPAENNGEFEQAAAKFFNKQLRQKCNLTQLVKGCARWLAQVKTICQTGPTEFKLGFGGEAKPLPGVYFYFTNPLLRAAMRAGGIRLLDSKPSLTLTRKLARGR